MAMNTSDIESSSFSEAEISNWLNWQISSNQEYLIQNFVRDFIDENTPKPKVVNTLTVELSKIIKQGHENWSNSIVFIPIPYNSTDLRPYNCEIFENTLYIRPSLNLYFGEVYYMDHPNGTGLSFLVDGKPMRFMHTSNCTYNFENAQLNDNEVSNRVSGIELNQEIIEKLLRVLNISKPLYNMIKPLIKSQHTLKNIKYIRYVHELQFCLKAYNQTNDLKILDELLYSVQKKLTT